MKDIDTLAVITRFDEGKTTHENIIAHLVTLKPLSHQQVVTLGLNTYEKLNNIAHDSRSKSLMTNGLELFKVTRQKMQLDIALSDIEIYAVLMATATGLYLLEGEAQK